MGMEQWQWSFLDTTQMFWGSNLKCQQESSEAETLDKSYSLGPIRAWNENENILAIGFYILNKSLTIKGCVRVCVCVSHNVM